MCGFFLLFILINSMVFGFSVLCVLLRNVCVVCGVKLLIVEFGKKFRWGKVSLVGRLILWVKL